MKEKDDNILMALVVGGMIAYGAVHSDRFSRVMEYELMFQCVGITYLPQKLKIKKTKLCACALEKTQENGWLPDYDNNRDYAENAKEFGEKYKANIEYFADHQDECKWT